ncbi:MAG TPA: hypothetical protein VFD90_21240 [Gaiellales bacterium]|jgi:uncharacterized membrane protein YgaE (UPF0421/DUF939 family)|nr:hypothetical protein [Gaiellales bacterium]
MHAGLEVARRELPRAIRIAVAATLSCWIARMLGRPVFAVIVPMVAIRDDRTRHSRSRSGACSA